MGTTLPYNRALIQEQTLANQNRSIMLNVTRHVFNLRADMARLRRFIDSYLNFVDDDMPPPFYFQPAVPFVTFELIYYPYLTVASRNLIAYPQREMSFSIPLECYAIEDGVLVFKQYASCTPFLYVDEELSVVSGRDLFGLPKVAIKFEELIDQIRPDVPVQIGRLTLRMPGEYGDRYQPFIEVYRDPSKYISLRQTPRNLISALPDAIRGYYDLTTEAWEAFARPPIRGFENQRDLQSMLGMLRSNTDTLAACFPVFPFMRAAPPFAESSADEQLGPLSMDIISLKQARDAERTESVSFQALVRSTMYVDRINDGGFLFNPPVSDPHGDVTIKIHRQFGQPLVESLGLVTEDTISSGGSGRSRAAGGRGDKASDPVDEVSTLRPFLPYWMNVDLAYGLGTNLYWRGRDTDWSSTDCMGPPADRNRYLTIGSGALQEDASPLVSPKSRIWAFQLPLDLANNGPDRLRRLVSKYLENDCYVFRLSPPIEDLVPSAWMFIRNLNNTGDGAGPNVQQEVQFSAMVDFFCKRDGRPWGPRLGQALMPFFVLTDNQSAVFTDDEVYGWPTVRADIDFEGENWTSSGQPPAEMNVNTLIIPELYSGDTAENRRLLKLTLQPYVLTAQKESNGPPGLLDLPTLGLKQIVDCRLPARVDFQAIVARVLRVDPKIDKDQSYRPRKISTVCTLDIYRYGSIPLVQKMGLSVTSSEPGKRTTIDHIELGGVWTVPLTVQEMGAVNLAWRLGNSPWMSHHDPIAELAKIAPKIRKTVTNTAIDLFAFTRPFIAAATEKDGKEKGQPSPEPPPRAIDEPPPQSAVAESSAAVIEETLVVVGVGEALKVGRKAVRPRKRKSARRPKG